MKTLKIILPVVLSVSLLGCNQNKTVTNQPTTQTISVHKYTPSNVAKNDTKTIKPADDNTEYIESITKPTENSNVTNSTTQNKAKTNSNAAVKDVIIDGTGSLVFSKADGTFLSFAPVQGQKGDKGDKGDQGVAGNDGKDGADDKDGKDGVDGKDGRGIDHCELTDTKDLVIYYTDGTSQNLGNLTVTDLVTL